MNQQRDRPTVLLAGGTSQVGVFALPRILAAGFPVVACSRRILRTGKEEGKLPAARWFHPDAVLGKGGRDEVEEAAYHLHDVNALLSCGPVALAVQLALRCTQLRRVVCISSSSVYTKLRSPDTLEFRQIAAILASEEVLRRYCAARDITLVLLRPTLIYGCGLDRNISRIARLAKRFHFMPVAGQACGRRQPLHADDLAELVSGMLEAGDLANMESPVAGGSTITYREMVERIFTAFGQTPRIMKISPDVLATVVRAFSWMPFAAGLNAEMVYRQSRDLVFDDSRLRDEFSFSPRPFEPVPQDFSVPEGAAILQPR